MCYAADDRCLESLYPPGSCGTYCSSHTYDCYIEEVNESCCDENGLNCVEGQAVPNACPVGCAVVFPEFLETCRDFIRSEAALDEAEFERFEQDCLDQDGIALVDYTIGLRDSGCVVSFADGQSGRRRTQGVFGQRLGVSQPSCEWDELDDLAKELDLICCGVDNALCPASPTTASFPMTCGPLCAVAMHSFSTACAESLDAIFAGDDFASGMAEFEDKCLTSADPHVFLDAIMHADCSHAVGSECTSTLPGLAIETNDCGVCCNDANGGSGFIMYSEADVHSRMSVYQDNYDHFVCVKNVGGQWLQDSNDAWIAFTPADTDVLVASLDFTADTVTSLQGQIDMLDGMRRGFDSGDLVFSANNRIGAGGHGGGANEGEFFIDGSFFSRACNLFLWSQPSSYPGFGCLSGFNDVSVPPGSLDDCKAACIADPWCNSIDWYNSGTVCRLSYHTGETYSSTVQCEYWEVQRDSVTTASGGH